MVGSIMCAANGVILSRFVVLVVRPRVGWFFAFEDGEGFSVWRQFGCFFDGFLLLR